MEHISYIEHEMKMSKFERKIKVKYMLTFLLVGLLAGSNILWIIHFFG